MKYSKVIILFLIAMSFETCLKAQDSSNCIIYNEILFFLNSKEKENKWVYKTPKGGDDPEHAKFIKKRDNKNRKLFFYIVKDKQEFNKRAVQYWFSNLINDSSIVNKEYSTSIDSINQCEIKSEHKIVDFDSVLSFTEKDYFNKKERKQIIYYTPSRVLFSDILYINNCKALVFAGVKTGSGGGDGNIYGFIFEKKNKWQIEKSNIEIR